MRNRIISGLSQGTLIVEAGEGSGALITAKEAIVQGRDVYALPGNVGFANAVGTNDLIKSGATAVTCAADILENYRYLYGKELNLSVLARVSSRSSLKRGALKAHGVDEGVPHVRSRESQPPCGELSEMLHSAGKLDGETVKRISGETEYPMYGESPRIRSAETETKVAEAGIPSHLDPKAAAILRAMPAGQAVSFETLCGEGSEADDVMMMLTLLEIEGLVVTLPGNRYMRK
jgi:predicted Rossmann fold nucleotide-binding protein DprA/Smf involved in DNA uptake